MILVISCNLLVPIEWLIKFVLIVCLFELQFLQLLIYAIYRWIGNPLNVGESEIQIQSEYLLF